MKKIETRLEDLLNERGRSMYWLSKEKGIAYSVLWRLKTGRATSIRFDILIRICDALEVQPGDLLTIVDLGRSGEGSRKKL
ncbi:MAG: helix-turn-helix domain-containing protein [Blastocatellia bacterium]